MRRTIAIVLAGALLAAAGCGDDEEQEQEPARAARVSLTDFKIDPANPEARAGRVAYEVRNDGSVPHALEIEGGGEEFETAELQPGESATLEADLEAGEYEWYCPVGNHADRGMRGTLTVDGGDGGDGGGSAGGGGY